MRGGGPPNRWYLGRSRALDSLVIGSSVAKTGDPLFEPARQKVSRQCFRSGGCEIGIVQAELGDHSTILGCASPARRTVQGRGSRAVSACASRLTPFERAKLERVEGIVFDIQRFSLHDGAGLRTNVFFKGCAMRCPWCANPESQHREPELWYSVQRCIECGQFAPPCADCIEQNGAAGKRADMRGRLDLCPTGAIRVIGDRRTAGEVLAEVLRDAPFYSGGGGMTLTGGEPTDQPRLAEALLRLARHHHISTALETSGHARWRILERLLPHLDDVLFDVKHMDSARHRSSHRRRQCPDSGESRPAGRPGCSAHRARAVDPELQHGRS